MGNKVGKLVTKVLKPKKVKKVGFIETYQRDKDEIYFIPKSSCIGEEQKEHDDSDTHVLEIGQSSNSDTDSPTFICEICIEPKPLDDSFNVNGCAHFYCFQCIISYVSSKLDDNVTYISCPVSNCKGVLEPEYCRPILPNDVFDRWGNALCESVIVGSQKFYCPFSDCSALLINDGREVVMQSECPNCRRAFCAQCKVPWHAEYDCAKFRKLMKCGEDKIIKDLAKRKKWRRCPTCKYYVEKSSGCMYIKCRCGYAFCYNCGGCSSTTSHVCPRCKH